MAPRFSCEGKAQVAVLGGALRFTGTVHDLSTTGCRLTTDAKFTLERGTQVEIMMEVNRVQFRVAGGVRTIDGSLGVGLEFMNVSARCARYIHDLIGELKVQQKGESVPREEKDPAELC